MPLVQLVFIEYEEGRILEPTVEIYIFKESKDKGFDIEFTKRCEKEIEEQDVREAERWHKRNEWAPTPPNMLLGNARK